MKKVKCQSTQSCPTLCDPMDYSPPRLLCPRDSSPRPVPSHPSPLQGQQGSRDFHQALPPCNQHCPSILVPLRAALGELQPLTRASLVGSSGFLTTGVFRAREEGTSRGLLELGCGDGNGGCAGGVGRHAGLPRVLAGFRGASGGWSSREVLASSRVARAAGFGALLMTGAFLGWLAGLGACREGGLLGAFLITAGKGGDRGR